MSDGNHGETKGKHTESVRPRTLSPVATTVLGFGSLALLWSSWRYHQPGEWTESVGFITGAWCVWLAVKEHLWNWPVGIASSIFFIFVFANARLYADMGLQVIYVVLGVLGWYWWLHGGRQRKQLRVSRTSPLSWVILSLVCCAGALAMALYLTRVHDSAPFWDALTTALSLVAQYMLTRKLLENWYVWMTANVLYVGLYLTRHLYLTAGLYVVFFGLCLLGLREWRRTGAA